MATGHVAFSATWKHLLLLLLLVLVDLRPPIVDARKTRRSNAKFVLKQELRQSSGSSWDWISSMHRLNGSQFADAATPLLQVSTNAYNFNYQANPYDQEHLIAVQGWSLSLKIPPAAPPCRGAAGLRALVYEEEVDPSDSSSPRVILAFRGWQTSSTSLDELADLCAGKLLFRHYIDFLAPPSQLCYSLFTNSSLDYLSQATAYTCLVLQSYDPSSVILTGHGFGGGLAVLVSAALGHGQCGCNSREEGGLKPFFGGLFKSHQGTKNVSCSAVRLPVVSFSGPGTNKSLFERESSWCHIVSISQQWDFFSVRAKWKGHHGWLCVYEEQEPASCTACFSDEQRLSSQGILKPNINMNSVLKGKEKNDDDDDDDCDCDCDCDDDDDDCDCDNDDDDDDDCDCDDDNDCDCDDDDDDDDDCDDDDDDDDDCWSQDEPCWDCLSDTHVPESLLAIMEERTSPKCTHIGGPYFGAPKRKMRGSRRRRNHAKPLNLKAK